MAAGEERSIDFYAVLGLEKECSEAELRNAYKKLAMIWHPDRCTASGNAKYMEEAKKKFQCIQQAYSVLSDTNKRFLYDVGVYDSDDDQNGMGDFLNEMVDIMCQTECKENGEESFEELQELYEELFHSDIEAFGSTSPILNPSSSSCSSSSYASCGERSNASSKRNSSEMHSGRAKNDSGFDGHLEGFCFGTGGGKSQEEGESGSRRRRN